MRQKREGEAKRDKNDLFFLGIAIALRDGKNRCRASTGLSFQMPFRVLISQRLKMSGSSAMGVISSFTISVLKSERSGTDAKTKAYASGSDKEACRKFAKAFGEASGDLTELYTQQISQTYLRSVESRAREIYDAFQSG